MSYNVLRQFVGALGGKFFEEFKLQKNCEINLLIKTLLGLVEMMFGLVNVSFSLPEWQAVKMTFFAPCQSQGKFCKFPYAQYYRRQIE